MIKINEVIVVEGKYDKNKLKQIFDATILETSGFGIFNDFEKRKLLMRIAEEKGLVILTDSDGAGFVIRNYIKSFIPKEYLKEVYIPDIYGKERRKKKKSKEGKIGVEGISDNTLINAFKKSGINFSEIQVNNSKKQQITKADMYRKGLSGRENSKQLREKLLKNLDLPVYLNNNGLLDILNIMFTRDEFFDLEI